MRNETSQMKPARLPPEWRSFNAMLGCNISASDGVYGSLSDLLVDLDQWRIQYFVGRFHSWKKKSTVIIPTACVEQVSWMDEMWTLPARKKRRANPDINWPRTRRRIDPEKRKEQRPNG